MHRSAARRLPPPDYPPPPSSHPGRHCKPCRALASEQVTANCANGGSVQLQLVNLQYLLGITVTEYRLYSTLSILVPRWVLQEPSNEQLGLPVDCARGKLPEGGGPAGPEVHPLPWCAESQRVRVRGRRATLAVRLRRDDWDGDAYAPRATVTPAALHRMHARG